QAIPRIEAGTEVVSVLAGGGLLQLPCGVAVTSDGSLFVADGSGAVVRVDPRSGDQSLITQGQFMVQPVGIAADAHESILIADSGAHCVIQVNARTGVQRVVS